MPEAVGHVYRQLDIAGHGARDRRQIGGDALLGFSIGDVDPLHSAPTLQRPFQQGPAFPLRSRRADGEESVRSFPLRQKIEQGEGRQRRLDLPALESVTRRPWLFSEDGQQHVRLRRVSGIRDQANAPASPPKPFI